MARAKGRANGEGSIYEYPKGSGVWFAQLTLANGRSKRRRATTQREAREKLAELQRELAQGINLGAKQPTLEQWCDTWLDTFATHLKASTRDDYRRVLKDYVLPDLGRYRLDKLTVSHIQYWLNNLHKRVDASTVRNAYARLRTALNVAVENDYLARNVASRAKPPRAQPREAVVLTLEQARALLQAVEGDRNATLYYLALVLGMRQGELVGLRWTDVSWEKATLTIRRTLRRVGAKTYEQTPKTKSGERVLPLDEGTLTVLRAHWKNQAEEKRVAGEEWNADRRIFCTEIGTAISARNLLRQYKAALARAKLPTNVRFHDLRHSAGSLMLDGGAQLVTVSKILGHSSPMVTAAIYAHAFQDSQARAIEDLSQQLNPGKE